MQASAELILHKRNGIPLFGVPGRLDVVELGGDGGGGGGGGDGGTSYLVSGTVLFGHMNI